VAHNYAIVLSVDDGTGLQLAYRDDQLVTANGRPTNRWEVGEIVTTYHFLPFVAGTPPLNYEVDLRVYIFEGEVQTLDYIDGQGTPQGQEFVLGDVQVERPSPGQENVYGAEMPYLPLPEPLQLADGLQLTHALLDRSAAPGQTVRVRLAWQSSATLPDLRPRFVLRQGDEELVVNDFAPVQGNYPTNLWQPGDFIWEQRVLTVPATAESGEAAVFVELGEQRYQLGELEISAEVRSFEPPTPQVAVDVIFGDVARLVGFDPPPESVPARQPVPLTLYWQSLQTGEPVGYTVFAQVLGLTDGRVIAQHDSIPANGRRPTTGWVEGEYVQDEHLLTFREEGYIGEAQIIVGLYDPATGTRLTLPDGRDAFPLPVPLTVVGQ
jgi:hypothetical protein